MKMTINDILDNLQRYVYLDDRGVIVYETIIRGVLTHSEIVDLVNCCEDNIIDTDEGVTFDYAAAVADYRQMEVTR